PERIIRQSYYRVTLSPYSPALLLELGFMSNPLEYERAASGIETERAAKAIFDGIRRALM
ncbi:MAG: N-acetylmuramoyl-L-alanine amidase, partial [Oscillospiraceae bacterium]|nr:N-acetylmuramoyl-L-alanine amidase [Oscillospiraceae bacterium]